MVPPHFSKRQNKKSDMIEVVAGQVRHPIKSISVLLLILTFFITSCSDYCGQSNWSPLLLQEVLIACFPKAKPQFANNI